MQLDATRAPKSVERILIYVKAKHYNGTVFYRVAPGFVIQAGSYDAKGHYRVVHKPVPLEANNGLKNLRGAVAAYAKSAFLTATRLPTGRSFKNRTLERWRAKSSWRKSLAA